MIEFFIPSQFKTSRHVSDLDLRYKSRIFVKSLFVLTALVFMLCIIRSIVIGNRNDPVNVIMFASVCVYVLLPFYLKKTGDYYGAAKTWIILGLVTVPMRIVTTGGFASPVISWLGMMAVAAIFFIGIRFGILVCSLIFLQLIVIDAVDWHALIPAAMQTKPFPLPAKVLSSFFAIFSISTLVALIERERRVWKTQWQESIAHLTANSKLATLGEMAGGIAHEINTPLSVIAMSATQSKKILQRGAPLDVDMLMGRCEAIERTAARIAKIVEGLKSFSRDASSDPNDIIKVSELIAKTLDLCQLKFTDNHVTVSVHQHDETLSLECKPVQLSQVLLNLLNNAFDAIQSASEKWIRIEVTERDNSVVIAVVDSGQGIDETMQSKIFQPFFSTKDIGQGTGLGLSISLGIVKAHGGTLQYNAKKQNTTFEMILPKKAVAEKS